MKFVHSIKNLLFGTKNYIQLQEDDQKCYIVTSQRNDTHLLLLEKSDEKQFSLKFNKKINQERSSSYEINQDIVIIGDINGNILIYNIKDNFVSLVNKTKLHDLPTSQILLRRYPTTMQIENAYQLTTFSPDYQIHNIKMQPQILIDKYKMKQFK